MKKKWNDNWVTNRNVSHHKIHQFICAGISLQHEAKEMRIIKTNIETNFWHNSGIYTHCNSL
jgi:hypothetical protein